MISWKIYQWHDKKKSTNPALENKFKTLQYIVNGAQTLICPRHMEIKPNGHQTVTSILTLKKKKVENWIYRKTPGLQRKVWVVTCTCMYNAWAEHEGK